MYKMLHKNVIAQLIAWGVCALLLCGCGLQPNEVTVRVIASSDVHGYILDCDCLDGTVRAGSLAKLSTYLNRERKEYKNVIYLDAGDNLQGSVEMYHDMTSQFFRSSIASEAYNLLGCDALAMGNHDLGIGVRGYFRFFGTLRSPVVAANVYYDKPNDLLPAYRIIEKQGVKIAVLGLTTSVVNYTIPRDMLDVTVCDVVESAAYWVPYLRDEIKADVVIGLVHSGLENGHVYNGDVCENDVRRLVSEVSGFDLVIYGHDHEQNMLQIADCNGDSVWVINPGPYANSVAAVTITASKRESRYSAVSVTCDINDITAELPDKSFLKSLSGWYDDVRAYSDSIMGSFSIPLEYKGALWGESSVMDYLHAVHLNFMGAQVSLVSPVSIVESIPHENVTIKDLIKLYPYNNTLVSIMLKGSEIKNLLEYSCAKFYNTVNSGEGHLLKLKPSLSGGGTMPESHAYSFISAAGIDYTVDVTKPEGKRVTILSMSDGKPFDLNGEYRTTINSYLYSRLGEALSSVTDLSSADVVNRLDGSSNTDIRYGMITNLTLNREIGQTVKIKRLNNWRLIPENKVSECLRCDTVNFSFIIQED